MDTSKYIQQIIEQINLSILLDNTLGLYEILRFESSEKFKDDFHCSWDDLEIIYATGSTDLYKDSIYHDILPKVIDDMRKYIIDFPLPLN